MSKHCKKKLADKEQQVVDLVSKNQRLTADTTRMAKGLDAMKARLIEEMKECKVLADREKKMREIEALKILNAHYSAFKDDGFLENEDSDCRIGGQYGGGIDDNEASISRNQNRYAPPTQDARQKQKPLQTRSAMPFLNTQHGQQAAQQATPQQLNQMFTQQAPNQSGGLSSMFGQNSPGQNGPSSGGNKREGSKLRPSKAQHAMREDSESQVSFIGGGTSRLGADGVEIIESDNEVSVSASRTNPIFYYDDDGGDTTD